MNITSILIAAGGLVLAVLTYFAGAKRSASERARFEGEISASLKDLTRSVEKLEDKFDKTSDGIYDEIKRQISEHERRYHSNG